METQGHSVPENSGTAAIRKNKLQTQSSADIVYNLEFSFRP